MTTKYFIAGRNGRIPLTKGGEKSLATSLESRSLLAVDMAEAKGIIVCDADAASVKLARLFRESGRLAVLVRNEPRVVCPENFQKCNTSHFDKIIDVGRLDEGADFCSNWPQTWPPEGTITGQGLGKRASRAILVNANKLSLIRGELYSLRRKLTRNHAIDTYGVGWQSPLHHRVRIATGELLIWLKSGMPFSPRAFAHWFARHSSRMNPIDDKLHTMSRYKAALVIENSPEYLSEKLFDAFFAGCIPVYVGPDVTRFGIPATLVVEAKPTVESVEASLEHALTADRELWLETLDRFLNTQDSKSRWASGPVFDSICDQLESWLDNGPNNLAHGKFQ
jgi:alpha(1,3/1,4) fucosyltransferase